MRRSPRYQGLWVTAYTDAGYRDGRARCGCLLRSSVYPMWYAASGGGAVSDCNAAEMLAVLLAARTAAATYPKLRGLFIRTDSMVVVRILTSGKRRKWASKCHSDEMRRIVLALRKVLSDGGIAIDVGHVLAHGREPNEVRRWMNHRVDAIANLRRAPEASPAPSPQHDLGVSDG
jgi:ribonuclease HI